MAVTRTNELAADLQTYFAKSLLKQATYKTVLDQFGWKENIPSNSSKTISFTQYADLSLATTPLPTEGTPPTDTALSTSAITATIDQYGAFVTLTDLAELTVKHPVVTKAKELLGTQAARTYDRLINTVVVAGTSVIYADAVANRAGLGTANTLAFDEVRKAVALLRNQGAEEFDDGNFVCVVDPSVEMDLMGDASFRDAAIRNGMGQSGEMYKGTIAVFGGVRFVRSNNVPSIASTVTVHTSYVFGKDAYGVTDLQTLSSYIEGPGSVADPLHQKRTIGWKVGMKSVILNNNFMTRLESYSAY
ncbi:MAG: N4-gp56 family major capsid protein [Acidobacteria bacterium]|nr:N4-gp56 family major capsid protein [Acidobacteriota bacterium]